MTWKLGSAGVLHNPAGAKVGERYGLMSNPTTNENIKSLSHGSSRKIRRNQIRRTQT
jgi:hypothetical protein